MNILMLGVTFPRFKGDGTGKFVFELAKALVAQGETVDVLTSSFPGAIKNEVMDGVNVFRFKYFIPERLQRLTWPGGLPDQLKISWLARLQLPLFLFVYVLNCAKRLRKYDVVICNWIYTGVILQVACKIALKRMPHIIVIRGSDMRLIEKGGIISRVFIRALKKADAVTVVAKDFIRPLQNMGVENVYFTPNGVSVSRVELEDAKKKLNINDDKKRVIYVGSLIDRKDVKTLVRAMKGVDAQLVIVGDGEQRITLEQEAKDNGVDIYFVGKVPAADVSLWLALSDIFVLPSLYEGRPNALIEALAMGKACIATNIKGTRELIEDKVTGFLFSPGDINKLHLIISELLEDITLRERISANAQQKVNNEIPDWKDAAQNYIGVMNKILKSEFLIR